MVTTSPSALCLAIPSVYVDISFAPGLDYTVTLSEDADCSKCFTRCTLLYAVNVVFTTQLPNKFWLMERNIQCQPTRLHLLCWVHTVAPRVCSVPTSCLPESRETLSAFHGLQIIDRPLNGGVWLCLSLLHYCNKCVLLAVFRHTWLLLSCLCLRLQGRRRHRQRPDGQICRKTKNVCDVFNPNEGEADACGKRDRMPPLNPGLPSPLPDISYYRRYLACHAVGGDLRV